MQVSLNPRQARLHVHVVGVLLQGRTTLPHWMQVEAMRTHAARAWACTTQLWAWLQRQQHDPELRQMLSIILHSAVISFVASLLCEFMGMLCTLTYSP